jgi:FtsH ternary system-associated peptide
MAELTIRLVVDPGTGKKDILVGYHSDAGALPIEHEEEHRRLIDQLIKGGVLKAEEIGKVVVQRESASPVANAPEATGPSAERVKQKT